MKVLFYSTYHFNTETSGPIFENIQDHINLGDEVHILTCKGEMSSCQVNPNHNYFHCQTCISTFQSGLSCLEGAYHLHYLSDILKIDEIDNKVSDITWNDNDKFRQLQHEDFDIGMGVFSSVVSIFRDPKPVLSDHESLVKNQWVSSMYIYEAIKKAIDEFKIDLVYVFNARFATLRACLRAAANKNVFCRVLEEGRDRNTYSVFPNIMPHSIEHYTKIINELWDNADENKVSIAQLYFDNRSNSNNERVGMFTQSQEKGKLPNSWDSNRINIVFFTSSEDEFVAIGKDWDNALYENQYHTILKIAKSLHHSPKYRIYVRMHPNLKGIYNSSITDVISIKESNVELILPESNISSYSLLFSCNIVVTAGSTMGLEASVYDKPSILTSNALYMNLGCTYNPNSHEEVIKLIESEPKPMPKLGALKYGYMLTQFGKTYKYYKRIDTFQGLINGKKYGPDFVYLYIRKLGRWMRINKETRQKEINNKKQKSLYETYHG